MNQEEILNIIKAKSFDPESKIEKVEKKEDGRFLIFIRDDSKMAEELSSWYKPNRRNCNLGRNEGYFTIKGITSTFI